MLFSRFWSRLVDSRPEHSASGDMSDRNKGRFWPKAATGSEWRVSALPPKAAAR
jgi:hypothetical protein